MKGLTYGRKLLSSGFTLVELLLVIGIFTVLSTFVVINLLRPQNKASVVSVVSLLTADLKQQQIKAMVGDNQGLGGTQPQGIYFEADKYTLFQGNSYTPSPNNFQVILDNGITASTNLPSSQIIFSKRNGEVSGFTGGLNTITLNHQQSGQQTTITINRYGVISLQ